MELTNAQLETFRDILRAQNSADVIQLMQKKGMSWNTNQFPRQAIDRAIQAQLLEHKSEILTPLGRVFSDACREYNFWLDRDKTLPFQGHAPHLTDTYFQGKSVFEVGSGLGANLMSMSFSGALVCGIEPVRAYSQLGGIFFENEGLKPPPTLTGTAELLPLQDKLADVLLCVTAHQYFDLRLALKEFRRVLQPGGELIIVGGVLSDFLKSVLSRAMQGKLRPKSTVKTLINTFGYQIVGKRLVQGRGKLPTSSPIYPSRRAMESWLGYAGFEQISAYCKPGSDRCFHYRRA